MDENSFLRSQSMIWFGTETTPLQKAALDGRIETRGMEHFFDGTWRFGTAKLVLKKGKYFLHIPMTKTFEDANLNQIRNVVGVDLGVNFIATAYDSKGITTFFRGRWMKDKRAHFQRIRKSLQKRGTRSARRRLKAIGQRENRWMTRESCCL
jgi:putative transposase